MHWFGKLAATILAVGVIIMAGCSSASAHQGNITAIANCNTESGQYEVTYTLSWSNVPDGVDAEIYTRTGSTTFAGSWNYSTFSDWTDRGTTTGASGSIQWTETLPGDTVGNGPWVYAYLAWSNGYEGNRTHDTRIEGLQGDCVAPTPTPTPTPSTPEPTPTPSTPELPYTGVSDFWPLLAIGGGLLLFGSTLALVEHSQRRQS